MSASYLHMEINNVGPVKSKLYCKTEDLYFPIVNSPFIRSIIPAPPAYGV